VLDDYGLEKSIEWYLRQFQKQSGVQVHYEKAGVAPWIGEKVAIHVYRILQEGLNNVVRHAKTSEAWVHVRYEQARMEMEIVDHGPGLPAERRTGGIGMIGMRERAELLGGQIAFERPAEGGTRVSLRVPLPAGEKA